MIAGNGDFSVANGRERSLGYFCMRYGGHKRHNFAYQDGRELEKNRDGEVSDGDEEL